MSCVQRAFLFYIQLERSSKFIQKQIKFKIYEVLNDQEGYKIAKFILFNFAYMVILTCSDENLKQCFFFQKHVAKQKFRPAKIIIYAKHCYRPVDIHVRNCLR